MAQPQAPHERTPSSGTSAGPDVKRRRFLLSLGAGTASAAATAAIAGSAAATAAPATPEATPAHNGYRETKHVRDYYRSARI